MKVNEPGRPKFGQGKTIVAPSSKSGYTDVSKTSTSQGHYNKTLKSGREAPEGRYNAQVILFRRFLLAPDADKLLRVKVAPAGFGDVAAISMSQV